VTVVNTFATMYITVTVITFRRQLLFMLSCYADKDLVVEAIGHSMLVKTCFSNNA